LPKAKQKRAKKKAPERQERQEEGGKAPVRSFWAGTVTFGLVSIPIELYSAARPRQKSMKLVDKEGYALGRRYHCSADGKELGYQDLVRGYETESGEIVVITDDEFEAVAPEMSRDIELRMFVPKDDIPPIYFLRPYFMVPSGRSTKAYHLLAHIMERTGRAGIGSFVMRGHEYLVAIVAENGVLRAETLRYADEIRTPDYIELPKAAAPPAKRVTAFAKEIEALTENKLDMEDFEDRAAQELRKLAEAKHKRGEDLVEQQDLEEEDAEYEGSGKVIDLMEVLRKSLSENAVVNTARGERRTTGAPPRHARAKTTRRAG
jgi:DNA end-binding protein Ku